MCIQSNFDFFLVSDLDWDYRGFVWINRVSNPVISLVGFKESVELGNCMCLAFVLDSLLVEVLRVLEQLDVGPLED